MLSVVFPANFSLLAIQTSLFSLENLQVFKVWISIVRWFALAVLKSARSIISPESHRIVNRAAVWIPASQSKCASDSRRTNSVTYAQCTLRKRTTEIRSPVNWSRCTRTFIINRWTWAWIPRNAFAPNARVRFETSWRVSGRWFSFRKLTIWICRFCTFQLKRFNLKMIPLWLSNSGKPGIGRS